MTWYAIVRLWEKKMSILNDKNGQNDLNGIFIFNINIVE
jgi:hypothetical protein